MAYVDETFYKNEYFGLDCGTAFARLAARASEAIDVATMHRIVIANLSVAIVTLIKKATSAQIEFYFMNGDTYNESQTAGQESIGSYSRTVGYQQKKSSSALAPRAADFLEQTGLMFRGVI